MKKKKQKFTWIVAIVLVIALILFIIEKNKAGDLDDFARCLKDEGAVFYGAFWCPNCQSQKSIFARSARLLPYFECSTVNGQGQIPACKEKEIKLYPTWEFSDGSRLSRVMSLEELSEKTNCQLP